MPPKALGRLRVDALARGTAHVAVDIGRMRAM